MGTFHGLCRRGDVVNGGEQLSFDRASYVNPTEAGVVVDIVRLRMVVGRLSPHQIVVLASYNGQVQLIRQLLVREGATRTAQAGQVDVATVDGFQGRERAVILFSTRSNDMAKLGFMADGRRLNVALTRARQAIITVGDDVTLRAGSRHWASYLQWLQDNRAIFGQPGNEQAGEDDSSDQEGGDDQKEQEQQGGGGEEKTDEVEAATATTATEEEPATSPQAPKRRTLNKVMKEGPTHMSSWCAFLSSRHRLIISVSFFSFLFSSTGATQ